MKINIPDQLPLTAGASSETPLAKIQVEYANFPGTKCPDIGTGKFRFTYTLQVGNKIGSQSDIVYINYYGQ